jgi:hypothetical protein
MTDQIPGDLKNDVQCIVVILWSICEVLDKIYPKNSQGNKAESWYSSLLRKTLFLLFLAAKSKHVLE